ncbi:glycoside hydrolase [Gracilinema caldarium]|uniref:glycoside hydrolase n=1 Tax=Gracilinema caldarium TaxID=215591 RepID=UPI0026EC3B7D|nr:glycoside hydrolase [Gracilinema caldarium]
MNYTMHTEIDIYSSIQATQRILHPHFLSFTIDISLLLGGHWWGNTRRLVRGVAADQTQPLDLSDSQLVNLTQLLAPAMIRIGGTEADRIWYKGGKKAAAQLAPDMKMDALQGLQIHEYVLDKKTWKALHTFLEKTGMELLFTVSAGPADRDSQGRWQEGNALKLMAYSRKKGYRVAAWEFGNEVNGFPFIYGWKYRVKPAQYIRDFVRFGHLVKRLYPESKIIGPASAVWPLIGEPYPIIKKLCKSPAALYLDGVSWHFYPQQSSRGRLATRRAAWDRLLSPRTLTEVLRRNTPIQSAIEAAKAMRPASAPVENWMTETGHALYGGEPGLSDTFVSTLWWLDELGLLARNGVSRVFRQALVGSDYGLLDEKSLSPRPDYYASFLWKRLMGSQVHSPHCLIEAPAKLRLYLHSDENQRVSLLAINIDKTKRGRAKPASIRLFLKEKFSATNVERYLLEGSGGVTSSRVLLNGVPLEEDLVHKWGKKKMLQKYRIQELSEAETGLLFSVPPLSALFVHFALPSLKSMI